MPGDDKYLDSLGLSVEERAKLELEERKRIADLADEVSRRYDPTRLGKLALSGNHAGRAEPLDQDTRRAMEARLGGRFGDVRVVRGALANRVTKRHRADAVTIGATGLILLRETPRTNLKSPEGKALLAHELTHVKQAQAGMHFARERGGDAAAHEREAEQVERTILRDEKAGPMQASASAAPIDPEPRREKTVQRVLEKLIEAHRLETDLLGYDDK